MKVKLLFIGLILFVSAESFSQWSFGVSIAGIGFHPREEKNSNSKLYKWKIDKKGKLVAFTSISLAASYRLNNTIGIKAMQTFVLHDCAGKFAGISHFGVNFHDDIIGWRSPEDQFSLTFGPFWYYRKNWTNNPLYQNNPNFIKLSKNKVWEAVFVWYGGQIEYARNIDNNEAFTINFLPAYPYLYTFSAGMKTSIP